MAGVAVILLGLAALYAWATQALFLLRWFPGIEQMAPNTALCLVLVGTGLMFSAAPAALCRKSQIFLGTLTSILAGAVLFQYAFDLSVSEPGYQLFLNIQLLPGHPAYSGRMALQTAAALMLTGGAMILINRVRTTFGVIFTAIVILSVFFIALANALALLLHLEVIPQVFKYARMSPFTSAAVSMIGIGLLALHARRDRDLSLVSEDRKIVLLSGGLFLFAVLFAGMAMLMMMRHQVEEEFAQGANRSLHDRIESFNNNMEQALAFAQSLSSSRPLFTKKLAKVSAGTAGQNDWPEVQAVVDSIMTFNTISAVRLSNSHGRVLTVWGQFPVSTGIAINIPPPYRARLIWDRGYVLDVIVPLLESGRPIGKMEMAILLPSLTNMAQSLAGLGNTGEMLVCAIESVTQMNCFPSRHHSQEGMRLPRNNAESQYLPINHALDGEVGMINTFDYRGKQVIAAYGPVGSSGLGLVLKKDVSEVYQPFYQHAFYALPLLAGLVFVGIMLTRWWVLPLARELVRAKDRIRTILDNVAEGIVVFDRDGVIMTANPSVCRLFGYTLSEITGRRVQELLPGKCRDDYRTCQRECEVLPALKAQFMPVGETTGRRRDGANFPVELAVTAAEQEGEGFFIIILRDISQRLRDQMALRESEMRLRSVTTNVPGMVYQIGARDGVFRFPYVSEGSHAVCGLAPEKIQNDPETFFNMIHPEDRENLFWKLELSARMVGALDWEGRLVPAQDDVKWINCRATPRQLPDGSMLWDGLALNITLSKRAAEEMQQSRSRLRELAAHLESVREEERTRIAREMHDELGQWLTAMKMDIAGMRSAVCETDPLLADKMQSISALTDTTIEAVRRISADLRPPVLDLGLSAALEWQAQQFEARTGISCALDMDAHDVVLDVRRTTAIYRILQESLTNVARHAGASFVDIVLKKHHGELQMVVRDNGRGIDAPSLQQTGRFGLLGIRERVLLLGGNVRIEGEPGKGTTLFVQIPLDTYEATSWCAS